MNYSTKTSVYPFSMSEWKKIIDCVVKDDKKNERNNMTEQGRF